MRKLIVIGSLALAAVGAPAWSEDAGTTRPPTIPVSRFAALPDMYRPLLSPDGHRIAARKTADGSTTLVIIDADNPTARARGLPIGKWPVASLKWAGNQRLLLTVQSTFDINGYEFPFRRLIAIDVDTGTSRIADRKSRGMYAGDVLYTDPTGSWALVAGQDTAQSYPSVKRVDLATGDATVVERSRPDVWDWYADENGVVRAGISYDGPRWTIWYRDKAGEKLRPIRGKFPKDDDSTVDRFIFRGDHSWVVTNERTGRFGLYKYDLKTQTVGEAIFEHPEVDLDDVYYDALTGDVNAVEFQDDRSHVFWIDPEMKTLQAAGAGRAQRILFPARPDIHAHAPRGRALSEHRSRTARRRQADPLPGARWAAASRLPDAAPRPPGQGPAADRHAARRPVRARRLGI